PGRCGDGPRRQRVEDLPEGHPAADRSRDAGRGAPRLRALHRRLRDHVPERGPGPDASDLRVGRRPGGGAAAGERGGERDLPRGYRPRRRQRLLAVPVREENARPGVTTMSSVPVDLQKLAREHLWLHFTRMGGYAETEVPVIVRGEGCYLEDANGKRYLD